MANTPYASGQHLWSIGAEMAPDGLIRPGFSSGSDSFDCPLLRKRSHMPFPIHSRIWNLANSVTLR